MSISSRCATFMIEIIYKPKLIKMTIKEKLLKNCHKCHNGCSGCNTGEIFLDLCEIVEMLEDYELTPTVILQQVIDKIGTQQTMAEILERGQDDTI